MPAAADGHSGRSATIREKEKDHAVVHSLCGFRCSCLPTFFAFMPTRRVLLFRIAGRRRLCRPVDNDAPGNPCRVRPRLPASWRKNVVHRPPGLLFAGVLFAGGALASAAPIPAAQCADACGLAAWQRRRRCSILPGFPMWARSLIKTPIFSCWAAMRWRRSCALCFSRPQAPT